MSDRKDSESAWTDFLEVISRLRGEHGCPWDKQQTYRTLTKYVLEEAYELVSAAEEEDPHKLKEELGDLLLEVGLYCQIAKERGDFQPSEVLEGITAKLRRRHPHVFGEEVIRTPEEVRERWDEIKRSEPGRYKEGHSLMDEVQKGLPALMMAEKQGALAASVGFDWDSVDPVFDKVREELEELREAYLAGDPDSTFKEAGDLLLACTNLLRHLGVEAETTLLAAVEKFSRRFRQIERALSDRKQDMKGQTLEYLDSLWEEAKAGEVLGNGGTRRDKSE